MHAGEHRPRIMFVFLFILSIQSDSLVVHRTACLQELKAGLEREPARRLAEKLKRQLTSTEATATAAESRALAAEARADDAVAARSESKQQVLLETETQSII